MFWGLENAFRVSWPHTRGASVPIPGLNTFIWMNASAMTTEKVGGKICTLLTITDSRYTKEGDSCRQNCHLPLGLPHKQQTLAGILVPRMHFKVWHIDSNPWDFSFAKCRAVLYAILTAFLMPSSNKSLHVLCFYRYILFSLKAALINC